MNTKKLAELQRLDDARDETALWRKWGPYLSERQWGTVREDYSTHGIAWDYFTHDHARSRAYRWGEDGLAGFSDEKQRLCFALTLWNGNDPILKERLFGLTNAEGNHGEDVKECYFYLDSTPTHSYMKWLYKYPQAAYPYSDLVRTNGGRTRQEAEYELIDTGVFEEDRYFDVYAEYAKSAPEDVFIRITITNRGPDKAAIHLLPTLWLRNTWEATLRTAKPSLRKASANKGESVIAVSHAELGERWLYCDDTPALLFTENETNNERIFGTPNASPYVKDAFHAYLLDGVDGAVNPAQTGTKAAPHYLLDVAAGKSVVVRLRLSDVAPDTLRDIFAGFDKTFKTRIDEADEFYRSITPATANEDTARVMRQGFAGMLWSKQYYLFDAQTWLKEHGVEKFKTPEHRVRNTEWSHMVNDDVISMPDKWEYPWYAAWDLAFHAVALAGVDADFGKSQLALMLKERYQHPNGQMPAYEWNFGDVNPPVHAWATMFLYRMEEAHRGEGDLVFLKRSFHKLLLNFTWWVNRKDRAGHNVFEGGFLGLDNIGVFDRSSPLPTGGRLEQADGTAWMAMYCQNMLEIAFELAVHDPSYEDLIIKFAEHFLWIAAAMNKSGDGGMWDEEDGFYYDVLVLPDGSATRLKVRSLVGLLPLCATNVIEPSQRALVPRAIHHIGERLRRSPELMESVHPMGPENFGYGERGLMALVDGTRLRRILTRMLDENEFLGRYGIRSLSRFHADHPFVFHVGTEEFRVPYLPAESDTAMFGGNSNWRGPVWFPMNILLIRALMQFYLYYGDTFKIECPTGSGNRMNLYEVANDIANRLLNIFLRDEDGRRAVFGGTEKFQTDPHWRDHILFYEFFHGDNGAGIGASHQTGWTGLVSMLVRLFGNIDAEKGIEGGGKASIAAMSGNNS
jgi:hypothetical protein